MSSLIPHYVMNILLSRKLITIVYDFILNLPLNDTGEGDGASEGQQRGKDADTDN